jgi:hypothetical protein
MLASFANLTPGGNVATCTAGVKWWRACVAAIGDKNFQMGGFVACVPLKKNWTPSPPCVLVCSCARAREVSGHKKRGIPEGIPLNLIGLHAITHALLLFPELV